MQQAHSLVSQPALSLMSTQPDEHTFTTKWQLPCRLCCLPKYCCIHTCQHIADAANLQTPPPYCNCTDQQCSICQLFCCNRQPHLSAVASTAPTSPGMGRPEGPTDLQSTHASPGRGRSSRQPAQHTPTAQSETVGCSARPHGTC